MLTESAHIEFNLEPGPQILKHQQWDVTFAFGPLFYSCPLPHTSQHKSQAEAEYKGEIAMDFVLMRFLNRGGPVPVICTL